MISKTQTSISPRRTNYMFNAVHYYHQQPPPQPKKQENYWRDQSSLPDSLISSNDALTFEGKEFHYLDSMSVSFDEDIVNSFDTQDTNDAHNVLSGGADGRFNGFEMFPTYI